MSILNRKLRRDLGRHRRQVLAVGVTVFLGITMFAASYDSFRNLQASYDQTAVEFRFANFTMRGGDVEAFAAQAAGEQGVEAVTTRTVVDVPMRIAGHAFVGRVVAASPDAAVNRILIRRGGAPREGEVAVEEHLADHFSLEPGDTVVVSGAAGEVTTTVAGIASSPEYIWPARSRQEIIVPPGEFGVLFATEDQSRAIAGGGPNEAVVYYVGGQEDEALTTRLDQLAIELGAIETYTRAEQPSNAALSEDLQGFSELSYFFPMLFLTAAAMALYVMTARLVFSQRPIIGGLLANGFSRNQIARHYAAFAVVPTVVGAGLGGIVGAWLGGLATRLYVSLLSVPVTVIRFSPVSLVAGIAMGLAAALFAAIGPIRIAARTSPAAAMRGDVRPGRGRPSLLERVLPAARRLPLRWRMTLRGIERNPRRTWSTVVGVVLALVLVLVSWGMLDTIQFLMHRQFQVVQLEDARVVFTTPTTTEQVSRLLAVDGVAHAEPIVEVPVSIHGPGGTYETVLTAFDADTRLHRFLDEDDHPLTLPREGILVGKFARDALGADVGDVVTIRIPGLGEVTTRIEGYVDEPLGTPAYTSLDFVSAHVGTVPVTTAGVIYAEGVDRDTVRERLSAAPGVAAVRDMRGLETMMRQFQGLFYGFVGLMLAFGAALAFALIFNTMTVNIAERTREIGTLRAVGATNREIARLITAENLAVAGAGLVPGLVLGRVVAGAAVASYTSDLFTFDLHMAKATYVWAAIAILAVVLLTQMPSLRDVRRLDLATVIRERST